MPWKAPHQDPEDINATLRDCRSLWVAAGTSEETGPNPRTGEPSQRVAVGAPLVPYEKRWEDGEETNTGGLDSGIGPAPFGETKPDLEFGGSLRPRNTLCPFPVMT